MLLVLASANRDDAVFGAPDDFRLDRGPIRHLSLGQGRHSCIGAPLVRMEMEASLRTILEMLDNLAFKEEALVWKPRWGHRWLERLPVTFSPLG
ncbi:MAG: hypothetical protein GTO41_12145 [Burkholderiales bacterium]|nr:hypothetical protein [Burkholderiales bacterium]